MPPIGNIELPGKGRLMEKNTSICIRDVSKRYKIYPSRQARLKDWFLPFEGKRYEEKWVLRDISLDVLPGEAVGLVGMNGAGKSTLLKIVTGTTQPTTGTIEFHGSVAALLELGLGFHPDFTGRENVYMSGQLLGHSNEEISACMEDIEAFAEIGEAIDAPVRTYSSGMQVRLAFSVATMKRPDILIVDEALSVGDAYFQHKSFSRIRKFKQEGTTLLIVSHDRNAIQSICNRAILLDKGQVVRDGQPEYVMNYYNAMLGERKQEAIQEEDLPQAGRAVTSGTGEATVEDIVMVDRNTGEELQIVNVGTEVELRITVKIHSNIPELVIGMDIKDVYGQDVYGLSTYYEKKILHDLKAGDTILYTYRFPMNIGIGKYSITTALHVGSAHIGHNYEWKDLAYIFEVANPQKNYFVGTAWLPTSMEITRNGRTVGKGEF